MRAHRSFVVLVAAVAAVAGLFVAPAQALAWPPGSIATANINATVFSRGDTATVNVENTTPGGVLTMTLFGPTRVLARGVRVDRSASATISGRIPAGYTGQHALQVASSKGETFVFDITVAGAPDSTPPGPVTGLTATPSGSTVTLAWTRPADRDVARVRVFRAVGTTPPAFGEGVAGYAGSVDTSYVDTQLDGRTTYSWSVFAVDGSGNVSPAAGVTATTPRTTNVLAWGAPVSVDPFQGRPRSVSCPSATMCVAGDGEGNVARWDGVS